MVVGGGGGGETGSDAASWSRGEQGSEETMAFLPIVRVCVCVCLFIFMMFGQISFTCPFFVQHKKPRWRAKCTKKEKLVSSTK